MSLSNFTNCSAVLLCYLSVLLPRIADCVRSVLGPARFFLIQFLHVNNEPPATAAAPFLIASNALSFSHALAQS